MDYRKESEAFRLLQGSFYQYISSRIIVDWSTSLLSPQLVCLV